MTDELVSRVIDDLEPWRFFLAAWGYGVYARAVQVNKHGKRSNPGRFDTEQAVYLANCHIFVTCDREQRRMLRIVNRFGHFRRLVWHYSDVADWVKAGCPPIEYLDSLPGPYLVT